MRNNAGTLEMFFFALLQIVYENELISNVNISPFAFFSPSTVGGLVLRFTWTIYIL